MLECETFFGVAFFFSLYQKNVNLFLYFLWGCSAVRFFKHVLWRLGWRLGSQRAETMEEPRPRGTFAVFEGRHNASWQRRKTPRRFLCRAIVGRHKDESTRWKTRLLPGGPNPTPPRPLSYATTMSASLGLWKSHRRRKGRRRREAAERSLQKDDEKLVRINQIQLSLKGREQKYWDSSQPCFSVNSSTSVGDQSLVCAPGLKPFGIFMIVFFILFGLLCFKCSEL